MSAVRRTDTLPEMAIRRLLTDSGVHYRVKNKRLPGSPDIANRSQRWAIFVNGCFWHGHKFCTKTKSDNQPRVPKSRPEFWSAKLRANRSRDARKSWDLRRLGFRVLIVWECDLKRPGALVSRLQRFTIPRHDHD
ncbi:very short patch repair endonuclease [Tunturiibacter empetritectus]